LKNRRWILSTKTLNKLGRLRERRKTTLLKWGKNQQTSKKTGPYKAGAVFGVLGLSSGEEFLLVRPAEIISLCQIWWRFSKMS
jgi:hypothetical protein